MAAFFWICWIIDLLLCIIAVIGKGFANSFHASSSVPWLSILLIGCTLVGFILQVFLKKPTWALGVAALPLLVFLVMYLVEKATGE
jgi:hypothetical protein